MTVLGWRWRPAKVLGNSHRLSGPAPVRRFGRAARCARTSEERVGNIGRMLAEGDAHTFVAVIHDAGGKRDDLDQRLGVEQQEHAGDSVGE